MGKISSESSTPLPPYTEKPIDFVHVRKVILGSKSQTIICPTCRVSVETKVQYESSTSTHLYALLLACCFWPLVCLPYCVDSCKNANHYCPSCDSYIGTYG